MTPSIGIGQLGGPVPEPPANDLGWAAEARPRWQGARVSVGLVMGYKAAGFVTGLPVREGGYGWLELGVLLN